MKLEILMIDDDQIDIDLHRLMLERRTSDLKVTAFSDPDQAIDDLQARLDAGAPGPQIVTVDLYLPGDDGFSVAQRMKPLCDALKAGVGVLTGSTDPKLSRLADAYGLDFFAQKPLASDGLASIGRALGLFEIKAEGRRFVVEPASSLS